VRRHAALLLVGWLAVAGCGGAARDDVPVDAASDDPVAAEVAQPYGREDPFVIRTLDLSGAGGWIGDAVAYGLYRDGQRPGGAEPTADEIREDLRIMAPHWRLLRTYGAVGPPETLLAVIRDGGVDMKVLLGAWIATEERRDSTGAVVERFPDAIAGNRAEIETAVRLANAYPDIVVSVCVGNETQVDWSDHALPTGRLIEMVREVRARVNVPVTVADDYGYWLAPESDVLSNELDYVTTHAHPLWNSQTLEDAVGWTRETVAAVQAAHPGHEVVLGETGWATSMEREGDQARLITGVTDEDAQRTFHRDVTAWAREAGVPIFFFEAFDENWKGGDHPDHVEKHWGLFHADRTPKRAMTE